MNPIRRHERIMELLLTHREVSVNELSEQLGVTGKTIRADLEELETRGLLQRIHGGAVLAEEKHAGLFATTAPNAKQAGEKREIAVAACRHIEESDIIALDAGSTTLEIARQLDNRPLTVITNDLFIIGELAKKDRIHLVVPGGYRSRNLLVGDHVGDFVRKLNVQKAFVSTTGIHPEYGLTIYSHSQLEVKRAIVECAKTVICVADRTKFDTSALMTFAGWKDIDRIITDAELAPDTAAKYRDKGITVEIAKGSVHTDESV